MSKEIVVVGSSNTDMVIRAPYFPTRGETIIGSGFLMNAGGKGANQAVAVARLGGNVVFVCRTGNDVFGNTAQRLFVKEGINTAYIETDEELASGVAVITVNDTAENTIVVAPGANGRLNETQIDGAGAVIRSAGYLLMQLEIPLSTVLHAARLAFENGVPIILNPAPATVLPDELYQMLAVITPNEKEAALLSGINITGPEDARQAAKILFDKGPAVVIITLGSEGAMIYDGKEFSQVPAPVTKAVDTTAAGDVFNGALVVGLSEGMALIDAVRFACRASAISVTRCGAQSSVPCRAELADFS